MTGIVIKGEEREAPPSSSKEGDSYDRCPKDACVEVDPMHKIGGIDGRKEEYLHASMYFADPKQGGCGKSWSRTTAQGQEKDRSKGIDSKWPTRTAITGRSYSMPSRQYSDNFERIFGKGEN